jgi:hypothetical protein
MYPLRPATIGSEKGERVTCAKGGDSFFGQIIREMASALACDNVNHHVPVPLVGSGGGHGASGPMAMQSFASLPLT